MFNNKLKYVLNVAQSDIKLKKQWYLNLFIVRYLYFAAHLMMFQELRLRDVTWHDDYAGNTKQQLFCSIIPGWMEKDG
jgi:hypothetical protein